MKQKTITVTPTIAERYLEHNINNRSIKKGKLEKFAYSLSAGQWVQNGDSIRFDTTGTLIDGQHRLKAVIVSQVPLLNQLVITGLAPEAWRTIDDGTKRTDADLLQRHGVKSASGKAAISKVLMLIERGFSPENKSQKNLITKEELETWVLEHEDELTRINPVAESASPICGFSKTALGIVMYEINKHFGPDMEAEFIGGLRDGVPYGDERNDPRVRVRNWMLRKQRQRGVKNVKLEAQLAVLINAFNVWIHGKQMQAVNVPTYDAAVFPILGKKPRGIDTMQELIAHEVSPHLVAD